MGLFGKKKDKPDEEKDTEESTSGVVSDMVSQEETNPDLALLKATENVISAKNKIASNAGSVVEKKKSDSVFFQKLPKNPFKGV